MAPSRSAVNPSGTLSHWGAVEVLCRERRMGGAAPQTYKIRISKWGLGVNILKASRGVNHAAKVKTTGLSPLQLKSLELQHALEVC